MKKLLLILLLAFGQNLYAQIDTLATTNDLRNGLKAKIDTGNYPINVNYPIIAQNDTTAGLSATWQDSLAYHRNSIIGIYNYLGANIKAITLGATATLTGNSTLTSGVLLLTLVNLDRNSVLTGVKVQFTGNAPSYTGNNYNGVGLYSVNPNGTYTLVASSTNSATIWGSSAYVTLSIPFSSTYSATAGVYAVGLLYSASSATQAPQFWNGLQMGSSIVGSGFGNNIPIVGYINGQTSLPATITASTLTKYNTAPYIVVY